MLVCNDPAVAFLLQPHGQTQPGRGIIFQLFPGAASQQRGCKGDAIASRDLEPLDRENATVLKRSKNGPQLSR